jgi:phosphohistidine phosphatase
VRRLILFRHAKAAPSGRGGSEDRLRALVERGRKDSITIGAHLAADGFVPDLVLVSPAVRTQETWKFSAREFGVPVHAETSEQLYDATPEAILAIIKETPAKVQSLLVIAHNPGLHELALMLVASGNAKARARLEENLPTAGVVIVDFPFDDWHALRRESGRLERFVTPKLLRTGDLGKVST